MIALALIFGVWIVSPAQQGCRDALGSRGPGFTAAINCDAGNTEAPGPTRCWRWQVEHNEPGRYAARFVPVMCEGAEDEPGVHDLEGMRRRP